MSRATRYMKREVTEPVFQGNMIINISKVLNKKNMGVMYLNHCKTVRSRAQPVTSWSGQFHHLQTTKIKTREEMLMMITNQLEINVKVMSGDFKIQGLCC